jgi:PAS domain S-box-containing protein
MLLNQRTAGNISKPEEIAVTAAAFCRVADLLPDALLLVTVNAVVEAANAPAAALLGTGAGDVAGKRLTDFANESAANLQTYLHACARSTALLPGALSLVTHEGTRAPCRMQGALFQPAVNERPALILLKLNRNDEANRFIELNRRIDELAREVQRRRQAEDELADQERLLRVTLASIGDAVITTDAAGLVTFMNDAAQKQSGWMQDEALGRPLHEVFTIVNETTREPVDNPAYRVLKEGKIVGLANPTVLIRKDGSDQPIDDSGAPIRDAAGNVLGVVLVFHDITERRALEREVQARSENLLLADRRKDEFLAMLAHELRNPLAPIRNGVGILQQASTRSAAELHAVGPNIAAMMQRQVDQLTRLIDDLLDVARVNRGQITLRRHTVPLVGALERGIETVRPSLESQRLVFHAELPPSSVTVDGDLERLAQVFANILSNAVKFTDPGGKIEITSEATAEWVAIHIRDTGVGMPAALIPQVFDLFTQGDKSLARPLAGLGIGLSVVRTLVEMHGGRVEAHSAGPGLGSEFIVRLPLVARPESEQAGPVETDTASGDDAERRVLVVDDNVDAAASLAALLRYANYEVRVAHGGSEAFEMLHAFSPQVVLLDIGLPGMDGYDLAKAMRSRSETRGALLVAITGYGQESDRARAREAGFDHHLTKPVDFARLQALLEA